MANIKHTKNELKAQREALTRFERFLPMLQLKKQQLQSEMLGIRNKIETAALAEADLVKDMGGWIDLYSEPIDIEALLSVKEVRTTESNIAGVTIPVFDEVVFDRVDPDLFMTPLWIDTGLDSLEQLMMLRLEQKILEEQYKLIAEELRITSQRVNLFEKVKIPECREHIRVIKIFLGDEQTAGVVRAKIAKDRTVALEYGQ